MSKPRAATSVATSIATAPLLNSSRVANRSDCVWSPCKARALILARCKNRAKSRASILVLTKIIAWSMASCLSNCTTALRLWFLSLTANISCVTLVAVALRCAVSMIFGFFWYDSASLRMSGEKVAENNKVWRCLGNKFKIRCKSGKKPMSNMRSASSSTKYCT